MFLLPEGSKIFLACQPIDMRKSYQGLAILVEQSLTQDPFNGNLFVFYNKRRDRLKIIYWHINGFCLWMKRLEKGRFPIIFSPSGTSTGMTSYQLQGLIQGLEWEKIPRPQSLSYRYL
jgi:transposase